MSQEDQAEQEKKKPWYKRWWVIAIVVVVGLVVVGSLLPEAEDAQRNLAQVSQVRVNLNQLQLLLPPSARRGCTRNEKLMQLAMI